MATVTKPIALDETFNTTEVTPRNTADVLAQELSAIATAIGNQQSAGHTIENPAGGLMPQRDGLQFVDSHLNDDSANNRTQVEALKPVTSAAFETETEDGFYFITDEDEQPLTADDIPYDSNTSVGDMLDSSYEDLSVSGETIIESARVYRFGKIRVLRLTFSTLANGSNDTTGAILASKDRPSTDTRYDCCAYGGTVYRVTVRTNGYFNVYAPSAGRPNMYANIIYVTA